MRFYTKQPQAKTPAINNVAQMAKFIMPKTPSGVAALACVTAVLAGAAVAELRTPASPKKT